MFSQIAVLVVLILLNAYFAASEIAFISLNDAKIEKQAKEGNKKAKQIYKMLKNPSKFLATIQIGITLAGFLGSAFAADNFAEGFSSKIIKTFGIAEKYTGTVNTVSVVLISPLFWASLFPKELQ